MSTINASNYGDGTGSVPASAVLSGTSKANMHYDHQTPAVGASYNISSVTDDGTGLATPNFSNAFNDTLYRGSGSAQKNDASNDGNAHVQLGGTTTISRTSALDKLAAVNPSAPTLADFQQVQAAWLGDLA